MSSGVHSLSAKTLVASCNQSLAKESWSWIEMGLVKRIPWNTFAMSRRLKV